MRKKDTKYNIYQFVIINLIPLLSIIIISSFLNSSKYNVLLNYKTFMTMHLLIEIISGTAAICILVLLLCTYPYEKDMKYTVFAGFFLLISLISIYHLYFAFYDNSLYPSFTLLGFMNLIILFAFAISFTLPDDKIKKSHALVINLISLTLVFFTMILLHDFKTPLILFISNKEYKKIFYTITAVFYLLCYAHLVHKLRKKWSKSTYYNFLSINIFMLSNHFYALSENTYDVYFLIAHILCSLGLLVIFNVFLINIIKLPYEKMYEAEKKAMEEGKIKTDFIINMSHELRTPVNVIQSALDLLDVEPMNLSALKSIRKNTLRIKRLFENIIEFNDIENNGKLELELNDTDVVFLIDDILEEADEALNAKDVDIDFKHLGFDIAVVDSDKLRVIFLNLISNAIKYCPNGGDVHINLNMGKYLDIKILNNGPGFLPEDINKVFDKFYKSKDKRLESTEGLGLGLFISRKYAEAMGGKIEILNLNNMAGYRLKIPVEKSNISKPSVKLYSASGFFSDIN